MASVQEPGTIRFYAETPDGKRHFITQKDVSILGPGASADGVKASTANADNQLFLQPTGMKLRRNSTLLITSKTVGTDGIDVSDCFVSIPYKTPSGIKTLSLSDFTNPTPVDYTSTAGVEQVFGGYLVIEDWIQLGGDFVFFSLEDDT